MKIDKKFNAMQVEKLKQLLTDNRENYRVDLHLHTSYSADGIQSVEQAFCHAKENHFDIISITDHDSILAYNEILSSGLYMREDMPIVIPGIEFTVSYPEYMGRCHVLKYFFDEEDEGFINNLNQTQSAYGKRINLWFQRIEKNRSLQYFFQEKQIDCSEDGFRKYLWKNEIRYADYPILMKYIYMLLSEKQVSVWDVYNRSIAENELDICEERKQKRKMMLSRFYEKYRTQDIGGDFRKLRPILAPVGLDDYDYPEYESSGSLSISEFGQVGIRELDNAGFNILAHPDINRLSCVDELEGIISGLELNCHSSREANNEVEKKAIEKSMLITKGSDKHDNTVEFYEDLNFYEWKRVYVESFLRKESKLV